MGMEGFPTGGVAGYRPFWGGGQLDQFSDGIVILLEEGGDLLVEEEVFGLANFGGGGGSFPLIYPTSPSFPLTGGDPPGLHHLI